MNYNALRNSKFKLTGKSSSLNESRQSRIIPMSFRSQKLSINRAIKISADYMIRIISLKRKWMSKNKVNNKNGKMYNGNIKNNIKMMQFNKGNSKMITRLMKLETLLVSTNQKF